MYRLPFLPTLQVRHSLGGGRDSNALKHLLRATRLATTAVSEMEAKMRLDADVLVNPREAGRAVVADEPVTEGCTAAISSYRWALGFRVAFTTLVFHFHRGSCSPPDHNALFAARGWHARPNDPFGRGHACEWRRNWLSGETDD